MDVKQLREDSARAWEEDGNTYVASITLMPGYDSDSSDGAEASEVHAVRLGSIESAIEAVESSGWALHTVAFGNATARLFGRVIEVPEAVALFRRPAN